MHGGHNQAGAYEGYAGSEEPSADYRYNACNTEYGALTAPGTVGKRGTHGYHKGDEGGGERQFQRGTQRNQRTGQHQVDRAAHEVEGRLVLHDSFVDIEAAVEPTAHPQRSDVAHPGQQRQSPAHQTAGYARRTEHFVAALLAAEANFGFSYVTCLFRRSQRHHHNHSGSDKEVYRGIGGAVKRAHQKAVSVAAAVGHIVLIGCQTAQGHTDKVHQVVASESHGKREGAYQHYHLEHIHLKCVQQLHKHCKEYHTARYNEQCVAANPGLHLGSHETKVLGTLYQQKVYYGRGTQAAENAYFPFELAAVVERKHRSRYKLHHRAEHKGYCHRKEYSDNHRQRFFGVKQLIKAQVDSAGHLYQRYHKGGAQQFEHHRHRGGCRHAQCVEYIKQYDIRDHHRHEYTNKVVERKMLGPEYAVSGYVHHAVAHGRADKHAYRGYYKHPFERCGSGAYRRVEKVDSVVAYSNRKVEHR